jgi:hypothetical protein
MERKMEMRWVDVDLTLKRAPMEENLEDLDVSSGRGGNNPDINEHLEALRSSWCSATT